MKIPKLENIIASILVSSMALTSPNPAYAQTPNNSSNPESTISRIYDDAIKSMRAPLKEIPKRYEEPAPLKRLTRQDIEKLDKEKKQPSQAPVRLGRITREDNERLYGGNEKSYDRNAGIKQQPARKTAQKQYQSKKPTVQKAPKIQTYQAEHGPQPNPRILQSINATTNYGIQMVANADIISARANLQKIRMSFPSAYLIEQEMKDRSFYKIIIPATDNNKELTLKRSKDYILSPDSQPFIIAINGSKIEKYEPEKKPEERQIKLEQQVIASKNADNLEQRITRPTGNNNARADVTVKPTTRPARTGTETKPAAATARTTVEPRPSANYSNARIVTEERANELMASITEEQYISALVPYMKQSYKGFYKKELSDKIAIEEARWMYRVSKALFIPPDVLPKIGRIEGVFNPEVEGDKKLKGREAIGIYQMSKAHLAYLYPQMRKDGYKVPEKVDVDKFKKDIPLQTLVAGYNYKENLERSNGNGLRAIEKHNAGPWYEPKNRKKFLPYVSTVEKYGREINKRIKQSSEPSQNYNDQDQR